MFKIAQLKIKAAGPDDDLAEGEFTAYASVFGNRPRPDPTDARKYRTP